MITWSEQLPCTRITAFSLTSLFFEGFCCELYLEYISGPTNLSAKPKVSFVTSHIYNAFMNEVELPFS